MSRYLIDQIERAMSYARQLLDTYPRTFDVDAGVLAAAIDALNDCVQACTADTAADLSERNVTEMVNCVRLCLDCADICVATVGVTSRQTEYDATVINLLLEACAASCAIATTASDAFPSRLPWVGWPIRCARSLVISQREVAISCPRSAFRDYVAACVRTEILVDQ